MLVVIDVQERFLPHLPDAAAVVENCRRLLIAARLFGIPALATEQYPRGLGPTAAALREFFPQPIPEKLRFSSVEALGLPPAGERHDDRHVVVLCGIETHVCVLQTALDLLADGYDVTVAVDAVASRRPSDHEFAVQRLAASGVTVSPTEALIFEWCETAAAPEFKQLVELVRIR
jgi:nicotinamidase-related amidase